ncbi:MAG: hypothetical protein CME61_04930 [Halobacteriovoraceae bacterium]|nr:hypothetical protein [Halobacteriovoraceae bacterium]
MVISRNIEYPKARQQGTMELNKVTPPYESQKPLMPNIHRKLGTLKHQSPHRVSYQAHIPPTQDWVRQLDIY